MKTEVTPKIRSGFLIKETELARLKDAINEQFKKIDGVDDAIFSYQVKYRNGTIASVASLSELLQEENDGTRTVIRLVIEASAGDAQSASVIVWFSDISHDSNSDTVPINYGVTSDNKDWTFVTSSTIDERITKLKVNKFFSFIANPRSYRMLPVFIMAVFLFCFTMVLGDSTNAKIARISHIRATSKSMWEYMYRVDTMKTPDSAMVAYLPYLLFASMAFLLFSDYLVKPVTRWMPLYTFYWGDRVKIFDRKMAIIKFVFGGIFLAIILGVIGNFVYDYL